MKRAKILTLAITLCGCGHSAPAPPTLDAASDAAYEASTMRMAEGMTRDQQEQLGRSIGVLTYRPPLTDAEFAAGVRAPGAAESARPLHGLTAAQINDRAAAKLAADAAAAASGPAESP